MKAGKGYMVTKKAKEFEDLNVRIKKNILMSLNEDYLDDEDWSSAKKSLVTYAIFFHGCCEDLLLAILIFNYRYTDFIKNYLLDDVQLKIDVKSYQKHHGNLIKRYLLDKAVVSLLIHNEVNKKYVEDALIYHSLHISEHGYKGEADIISDANANPEVPKEYLLSTLIPKMMMNLLLNTSNQGILDLIDINFKSREKIWLISLHFMRAYEANDEKQLNKTWMSLVEEWQSCHIKRNSHAYTHSYFVLTYYLYCEKVNKKFDIQNLAEQVMDVK